MKPKWIHGKRKVVEPHRLLEIEERGALLRGHGIEVRADLPDGKKMCHMAYGPVAIRDHPIGACPRFEGCIMAAIMASQKERDRDREAMLRAIVAAMLLAYAGTALARAVRGKSALPRAPAKQEILSWIYF